MAGPTRARTSDPIMGPLTTYIYQCIMRQGFMWMNGSCSTDSTGKIPSPDLVASIADTVSFLIRYTYGKVEISDIKILFLPGYGHGEDVAAVVVNSGKLEKFVEVKATDGGVLHEFHRKVTVKAKISLSKMPEEIKS